jgi:hypothetical protein
MLRVFDRPTPIVLNGLRLAKRATEAKPEAAIWFKDIFGKNGEMIENTVRPHIEGGMRNEKSSERRLKAIHVLRPNEWLVGVKSARNAYGNISGPEHQRMLSYFRAYTEAGITANRRSGAGSSRSGIRYFVNRAGAGRGIYRVRGRRGKPQLIWHIVPRATRYMVRFRFYDVAQSHADVEGPRIGRQAMTKAVRKALR